MWYNFKNKWGRIMDFNKMLEFVKKTLEDANKIKPDNPKHPFRSRYTHSLRVYEWARYIHDDLDCNEDILYTAAIFHDVGYAIAKQDHAKTSAMIFEKYAKENHFDEEFISRVYDVILHHSDKSLLKNPTISNELILLLEADLLDEEGALGIVWDFMAIAHEENATYYNALDALKHSRHILEQEYMITPKAKQVWKEKQDLVRLFDKELRRDLFEE